MKNLGGVVFVLVLGMLVVIGSPAQGPAHDSESVVHPAPASPAITVTVTDLYRTKHGHYSEVVIAQAVGFPNDTCDVITTFDVVKKYEERQTWSNVKQRLDIVVDGTPYPATFRDIGFYPLGLNLACIDFESPLLHAELNIPVLQLDLDSPGDPSPLSYDDTEIKNSNPGTPFLNIQGEVSWVLVAIDNGQLEFASADDVRTFLKVAANVAPPANVVSQAPLANLSLTSCPRIGGDTEPGKVCPIESCSRWTFPDGHAECAIRAAGWNTASDELRAPLPQGDGVSIGKACECVEVIAGRVPHQRDTGHRRQSVAVTERFYAK